MKLSVRQLGGVSVIDLAGRITIDDGDELLRRKVDALLQEGRRNILLNLEAVSYVDSGGVGGLAACYREAARNQGALKLLNPRGRVHDLLRLIRLHEVVELFEDEQDALRSFSDH